MWVFLDEFSLDVLIDVITILWPSFFTGCWFIFGGPHSNIHVQYFWIEWAFSATYAFHHMVQYILIISTFKFNMWIWLNFLQHRNVFLNFYLTHFEKYNTGVLYLPHAYDFTMWVSLYITSVDQMKLLLLVYIVTPTIISN